MSVLVASDEPLKKKRCIRYPEPNEKSPHKNSSNYVGKLNGISKPKFRLKNAGKFASLSQDCGGRLPLVLTDIQNLLLHSFLGNQNHTHPARWYHFDNSSHISQTMCIIFEGISINHWKTFKEKSKFDKLFNNCVEIFTPAIYNGSLVKDLALVPLSQTEKETLIQKYGDMNSAMDVRKDIMMKGEFLTNGEDTSMNKTNPELNINDNFPRTKLILSSYQLIEENFPVPLKGKFKKMYADYVLSKNKYEAVTPKSPMFGLDCEMCITKAGSELTRVSVVNENYEVVYESFVKPYNNITDYLTRFSGITESSLSNVTKRLEDVQNDLRELLPPDAILIGQSLNFDLHALKMMHPYVIDTSCIYNFSGDRGRKTKLKILAKEFLNEDIQTGKSGHCSAEDALTALKLVQLKLSKCIEFGDSVQKRRQCFKERLIEQASKPEYGMSIFNHIIEQEKTALVVGCDNITGDYHSYLSQAKNSLSNHLKKKKLKKVKLSTVDTVEEVISTVTDTVNDYNFIMAHLKIDDSEHDDVSQKISEVDRQIEHIWESLNDAALCVVIFGGTTEDNGVAMINIKHNKCK
ncbi:RNA exonuclease 5 [Leptidea sinapis]|uniref:RNA exonuclease 5 n=1 Tax=Leptidea sinapis TaxID=189913 RepID=UPI002133BE50|nr:RNA exonuclease 5 [Leptidea sinapis]